MDSEAHDPIKLVVGQESAIDSYTNCLIHEHLASFFFLGFTISSVITNQTNT